MIDYYAVGGCYVSKSHYTYYSSRYKKSITVPEGYPSNGADVVKDLVPDAFFVHDRGCEIGTWDDGTEMCNRELSFVYYDILRANGVPWSRCVIRWVGTFMGGGGQARKNGLWRVKNG